MLSKENCRRGSRRSYLAIKLSVWWRSRVRTRTASAKARAWASPGCIAQTAPANTAARARRIFATILRLRDTVDGGYAEYVVAAEDFVYSIPEGFADEQAAPLLCAGIIGFRSLRLSGIKKGGRLGLYGFGAAAHVAIQVARHWGAEVYASTRDARHQKLALELGAVWAGGTLAEPPVKLDAAIIFAPAGEIVPAALKALKKGGTLTLGGIHMSPIPALDYDLLYGERVIRSVANNTRKDGEEFLRIAAEIPIRTQVQRFALREANQALNQLKNDAINGAAVLVCDGSR